VTTSLHRHAVIWPSSAIRGHLVPGIRDLSLQLM